MTFTKMQGTRLRLLMVYSTLAYTAFESLTKKSYCHLNQSTVNSPNIVKKQKIESYVTC